MPSAQTEAQPTPGLVLTLAGVPAWADNAGRQGPLARKDAALLALLALTGPLPPQTLATWVWPQASAAVARGNLRQRVFRLRRDLGPELIVGRDQLRLGPDIVHDLAHASPQAGELLGAFDYGDAPELDAWVQQARQQWTQRRADALAALAAAQESAGELTAALASMQRLVALLPLHEHGWRCLMRLHHRRGDRGAAIAAFEALERQLRDELGSRPSEETLALLAQVEQSAQPAPARRVVPPVLVRPPRLVGRERPWRALAAAWDAGQAFVLLGVAGRGKTRLLTDFVAARGLATLSLQARPGDDRSPYALVQRLLDRVPADAVAALQADRPEDARELARLHPRFGTAPAGPGHEQALWRAVEALFRAAEPLGLGAVVVDDLQFADLASLELLRWLIAADALAGLRFGLASRPVAESALLARWWADWWAGSSRPQPVPLSPLAEADVAELLRSLALPALGGLDARTLSRHAGGEPFHLLETLKDLVLHGGADQALPRPHTVSSLLARRLDELPTIDLDLLRVAALAGPDFNADRAAAMLVCSLRELAGPWSRLESLGLLQGHALSHDLLREAVLDGLPSALRAPWHAVLAGLLAEDDRVPAARQAAHWRAAGRMLEAGEALFRAAQAAHRAGRLVEHGELLDAAAEAFGDAGCTERRFDAWRLRLDSDLLRLGGQAVVDRVAALAPLAATPRQQAELLRVGCEAWLNLAQPDEVLQRVPLLAALAAGDLELEADWRSLQGRALVIAGRPDQALPVLMEAVQQAQALQAAGGPVAPLARAWGHRAVACHALGRLAEAIDGTAQAARLALAAGDPADHTIHTCNLGVLLMLSGEVDQAAPHAEAAAAGFQRLHAERGDPALANALNLGVAWAHQGRLAEAVALLQTVLERLPVGCGAALACKAHAALGELWSWVGDAERMQAVLAAPAARPSEAPPLFAALHGLLWARFQPAALSAALALATQVPDPGVSPGLLRCWLPHLSVAERVRVMAQVCGVSREGTGLQRSLRLLAAVHGLGDGRERPVSLAGWSVEAGRPLHAGTPPWWADAWLVAHGRGQVQAAARLRVQAWCRRAQQGLAPGHAAGLAATLAAAMAGG